MTSELGRVGIVARFRPVHLGHAAVLEALRVRAQSLVIGIGSSNRVDLRNPWSAAEVREMLGRVLGDDPRVVVVDIPDLDDGPRWRALVLGALGPLDHFFTANEVVRTLLAGDYLVSHPGGVVPALRRVALCATDVRVAIAEGGDAWRALVPGAVAEYLEQRGLVARFRRDFGAATLTRARALAGRD